MKKSSAFTIFSIAFVMVALSVGILSEREELVHRINGCLESLELADSRPTEANQAKLRGCVRPSPFVEISGLENYLGTTKQIDRLFRMEISVAESKESVAEQGVFAGSVLVPSAGE